MITIPLTCTFFHTFKHDINNDFFFIPSTVPVLVPRRCTFEVVRQDSRCLMFTTFLNDIDIIRLSRNTPEEKQVSQLKDIKLPQEFKTTMTVSPLHRASPTSTPKTSYNLQRGPIQQVSGPLWVRTKF